MELVKGQIIYIKDIFSGNINKAYFQEQLNDEQVLYKYELLQYGICPTRLLVDKEIGVKYYDLKQKITKYAEKLEALKKELSEIEKTI